MGRGLRLRFSLAPQWAVAEGHPDKLADRIADAILDQFLRREPEARVACETLPADQCVLVAGEFHPGARDLPGGAGAPG